MDTKIHRYRGNGLQLLLALGLFTSIAGFADDPQKVAEAAQKITKALRAQTAGQLDATAHASVTDYAELAHQVVASFKERRWGEMCMDLRALIHHPDPVFREVAVNMLTEVFRKKPRIVRSFEPELISRVENPHETSPFVQRRSMVLLAALAHAKQTDGRKAFAAIEKLRGITKDPQLKQEAARVAELGRIESTMRKAVLSLPPQLMHRALLPWAEHRALKDGLGTVISALHDPDPAVRELALGIVDEAFDKKLAPAKDLLPVLRQILTDPREKSGGVFKATVSILAKYDNQASHNDLIAFYWRAMSAGEPELAKFVVNQMTSNYLPRPDLPNDRFHRCRQALTFLRKHYGKIITITLLGLAASQRKSLDPEKNEDTFTPDANPDPRRPIEPPPPEPAPPEIFDKSLGLALYEKALGPDFEAALAKLGAKQHWVDIDASGVQAAREYLGEGKSPFTRAQVTVATLAPRHPIPAIVDAEGKERLTVRTGMDIKNLYGWVLTKSGDKPADLVTDAAGALAAADAPDDALTQYVRMLKVGGNAYVSALPLRNVKIELDNGKVATLEQWILSLNQGIRVTPAGSALRITRTAQAVEIPDLEPTSHPGQPKRYKEIPTRFLLNRQSQ